MKVLLPGLAVGLIAIVAAWPSLRQAEDALRVTFDPKLLTAADPRMVRPRLIGVDTSAQPFTVTAEAASRLPDAGRRQVYELVQPTADITLKDGGWMVMTAAKGIFWRDRQLLELSEDVSLFQDAGYEFTTDQARIDLTKHTAEGSRLIRGQGPFGQIEAQGFRLVEQGARIDFTGKARLVLFGARQTP